MISKALRRNAMAAALAIAGTGLVGVAGTAEAQVFHRRLDTSLSIRASEPGPAGNAVIAGRLRSHRVPLAGMVVRLLSKEDGATGWTIDARERTSRRGKVLFRVAPDLATSYRLVFLGTRRFQPARSAVVDVVPRATALTIEASPPVVDPGGQTTISGVLTNEGDPFPGQTVELRSRVPGTVGHWVLEGTDVTEADGSVSFTENPERWMSYVLVFRRTDTAPGVDGRVRFLRAHVPGTSYRLFFAGGIRYTASTSPVIVS